MSLDSFMDTDSAIKNLINTIDLNPVINRMVKISKWTLKEASLSAAQYRNFLFLKKKYGDKYSLPPSVDIDEFWHNHILNTKKYFNDCEIIFGKYLHHTPHHGENNEITQQTLEATFENQTQALHFQEFGDYLYEVKKSGIKAKLARFLKSLTKTN
jgi:hypothetical protein